MHPYTQMGLMLSMIGLMISMLAVLIGALSRAAKERREQEEREEAACKLPEAERPHKN